MLKQFLEAGKIVNTHGIHGAVKIHPWTNSPDYLCGFDTLYIDCAPVRVKSTFVQKSCVIASLEGVDDIDAAIKLKNKVVYINRADADLEDDEYFIQDLIGLRAFDDETGEEIGVLSDVISLPSNDVYVIKGEREILVPAVPEFIIGIDIPESKIVLHTIEGM